MDKIQLVKGAKAGSKEALVQLIMDNKKEYYKLAYVYTGRQEDALDAMADMIVILYENIYKLKDEQAFDSWSKTILVNCCKSLLRKRKKLIFLEKLEEKGYQENLASKESKIDLDNYLQKLNPGQQEAIKLKYFLDMDNATISQVLKVPIGTVKSRISLGLKKLKEYMGGEY